MLEEEHRIAVVVVVAAAAAPLLEWIAAIFEVVGPLAALPLVFEVVAVVAEAEVAVLLALSVFPVSLPRAFAPVATPWLHFFQLVFLLKMSH